MSTGSIIGGGTLAVILVLGVAAGTLAGCPAYNVYSKKMRGEASYAEAEQNRRVAVLEATAKRDSAHMEAEAEVIRADGVSRANAIIAQGLGGPEGYLRYLWINQISQDGKNVIYVPTEAGLPILEAGKR